MSLQRHLDRHSGPHLLLTQWMHPCPLHSTQGHKHSHRQSLTLHHRLLLPFQNTRVINVECDTSAFSSVHNPNLGCVSHEHQHAACDTAACYSHATYPSLQATTDSNNAGDNTSRSVADPVSNHQASATTLHAPGYVKASVPFAPTVYSPQPSPELLFASAYGIPRPMLPVFESGAESDFALFKLAFDNLLSNHHHISEQYKYHVLLSHLKLSSAHQLAKSFMYHLQPYTAALQALQDKYGQPRQLIQSELGAILSTPPLKLGDANAFDSFALSVQSLNGMLRTLEGQTGYELLCGSHVDRLLSKLPPAYRDIFVEYCLSRGILQTGTDKTYTLPDFADWLQNKSQANRISSRAAAMFQSETLKTPGRAREAPYSREQPRPVLLTRESVAKTPGSTAPKSSSKPQPNCPHCDNRDHYLNYCEAFKKLTTSQIVA